MNLPNKLTLSRVLLVPVVLVFILYPIGGELCARIVAAALFLAAALTDLFDGKLARKHNLITNFGKFLDPLADKLMVIGVLVAMCASEMYAVYRQVLVWATLVVVIRELAVTSLRLLVVSSKEPVVIAASWLGKVKTNTQIVCIMTLILDSVILPFDTLHILSWITVAVMTVMTVWSGISYFVTYLRYLNPEE